MPKSKIFYSWIYVTFYCGFIFWFSSLSRPAPFMGSLQKYHFDFIFHGVEYGVLGALLFRAMFFSFERMPKWELFASVILLGVLYGVSDEWHQSFVPMRKPDFFDLLADSIGVVLGSVLYARSKSVQRSSV